MCVCVCVRARACACDCVLVPAPEEDKYDNAYSLNFLTHRVWQHATPAAHGERALARELGRWRRKYICVYIFTNFLTLQHIFFLSPAAARDPGSTRSTCTCARTGERYLSRANPHTEAASPRIHPRTRVRAIIHLCLCLCGVASSIYSRT